MSELQTVASYGLVFGWGIAIGLHIGIVLQAARSHRGRNGG